MSISQSQNWLKTHSDKIPALSFHHSLIIEALDNDTNSQNIVLYAEQDPGLSLALLKKINASRGGNSGKDIVESTKSAFALLGNQIAYQILRESEVAETRLTDPTQLFLFQQIINRSFHNKVQVTSWAEENGYHHLEQLQTCALLSYLGEILCCLYDFDHYLKYILAGSVHGQEQQQFGFSFSELTETICVQNNLPVIFIKSLPHKENHEQREQFLLFISKLCHQCEHGWYTDTQLVIFTQFAEFLQHPVDQIIQHFHLNSVLAARQSALEAAWQPASRLILLSDNVWKPASVVEAQQPDSSTKREVSQFSESTHTQPEKVTAENPPEKKPQNDIFSQIKRLIRQPKTTKSDVLNACINGLQQDFYMSKVSLLLLSQDKQQLVNRMSRGIQKEDHFKQYQIQTDKSGLLKILLKKPQSIWINPHNLKKYQQLIPASFLASVKTTDFFAMSLFIAGKPIGIIYADRSTSKDKLNEQDFILFKQLVALSSKALTFLSKK